MMAVSDEQIWSFDCLYLRACVFSSTCLIYLILEEIQSAAGRRRVPADRALAASVDTTYLSALVDFAARVSCALTLYLRVVAARRRPSCRLVAVAGAGETEERIDFHN